MSAESQAEGSGPAAPRALPAPPQLSDGVVIVRLQQSGDAAAIAAAVPAGEPGGWEATRGPYSLRKAHEIVAAWERSRRRGERVALAVLAGPHGGPAAPDEYLGSVVLQTGAPAAKESPLPDQLEGAYWIKPARRGNGFAARALTMVTTWALGLPPVRRIWLEVDRANSPSRRVAERSGYALVGLRWEVLEEGTPPGDVLIYERRAG